MVADVKRRLRRGVLAFAFVTVGLSLTTPLAFWDVLGVPFFYVLLPALALAQLPLLETEELERMSVYAGSALTILTIGAIGLTLGWRLDSLAALGLRGLPAAELWIWTLGVTAAGLAVIAVFVPFDRTLRSDRGNFLIRLLPRTSREKFAFVGLSASAGIGEELAYRGYALLSVQLLGPGPWTAAALSSAAFGFLHAYQGAVGILRTAIMGFILATPVLVTGSLLPAIIAHALIDLVAGLLLGPRLVARHEDGSASTEPGGLVPPSPSE